MKQRSFTPISIVILLLLAATTALARQGSTDDLVLRGKVRNIKHVPRSEPRFIEFAAALEIEFSNVGIQPIIVLKPQPEAQAEIFRLQIESLALSKLQAETYPYRWDIWKRGMYTSINTTPEYSEMAKRLDQALPPSDLTIVLRPGETWTWDTTCQLLFYQETPTTYVGHFPSTMDLGWDMISKIGTPLWMRLRFQLWSSNLQRADSKLRHRLQKRWSKVGYLIVQPELDTKAIEIKLNEIPLSGPSAGAPNNSLNPTPRQPSSQIPLFLLA